MNRRMDMPYQSLQRFYRDWCTGCLFADKCNSLLTSQEYPLVVRTKLNWMQVRQLNLHFASFCTITGKRLDSKRLVGNLRADEAGEFRTRSIESSHNFSVLSSKHQVILANLVRLRNFSVHGRGSWSRLSGVRCSTSDISRRPKAPKN